MGACHIVKVDLARWRALTDICALLEAQRRGQRHGLALTQLGMDQTPWSDRQLEIHLKN
jgi:hypothetical protein